MCFAYRRASRESHKTPIFANTLLPQAEFSKEELKEVEDE
jgi:hypothetical protein